MYEAFYMLRTRPFGVEVPPGGCWLTPDVAESLTHAAACLENGAEAVLITGPANSGKSTIARELTERLAARLRSVTLAAAQLSTSAALWHAVLLELGLEFAGLTEEEARLRVVQAARSLRPQCGGLLLVIDDAHELSDHLLEDLRRLSTQRHEGAPLVQLILCGTLDLEDRLAQPHLAALNQHIGQHVVLHPLTGEQSRQYIEHRLRISGGDPAQVFSSTALDRICAMADGNFRCLNQLCDHALLLGFANEERPVGAESVAAAIEDLKGLALPWNLPLGGETRAAADGSAESSAGLPLAADEPAHPDRPQADPRTWWNSEESIAVIEIGAQAPAKEDAGDVSWSQHEAVNAEHMGGRTSPAEESTSDNDSLLVEFPVTDRYAALDRRFELLQRDAGRSGWSSYPSWASGSFEQRPAGAAASTPPTPVPLQARETECLETQLALDVVAIREELERASLSAPALRGTQWDPEPTEMAPADPEWDVVHPDADGVESPAERSAADDPVVACGPAIGGNAGEDNVAGSPSSGTGAAGSPDAAESARRYAQLFTRLRRRRQAAARDAETWPLRLWR